MKEAKALKKGDHILHNEEPCRVKEVSLVVTGTHSHAKYKLIIENMFSGTQYNFTLPPHKMVEDLEIIRKHGQVISKANDNLQVMDMHSYMTIDARCDSDLLNQINEGEDVTFVEFGGNARVLEKR